MKTGDAAAGASYLVRQLTGGDHVQSSYTDANGKVQTFVDYGSTADVAIALASAGTQDATLAKVVAYLDAHVADYADPAGTAGGPFDGAAGKLALVNEIVNHDPASVDGTDLVTLLTSTVCTGASQDGACSAMGDFHGAYSGLGQVFPVLALARAQVTVPAAVLTRLDQLQCPDGGFSSSLIAPGAACTSDVDTTAAALQALALLPSESAVAQRAAQYLSAQQQSNGGFLGAAGENTNSTALAIQGFLASGGKQSVITAAQAFLASLQQADGGLKVNAAAQGSDLRASDQAVPAIAGATLTTLSHTIQTTPTAPTPPAPTTTAPTTSPPTVAPGGTGGAGSSNDGAAAAGATGSLPYTGWRVDLWAQIAVVLLLAGTGLLTAGARLRRRSHPAR